MTWLVIERKIVKKKRMMKKKKWCYRGTHKLWFLYWFQRLLRV